MSTSLEALIERQAQAWESQDIEAILADYHPDALFVAPGGMVARGHAEIRQAAQDYFTQYHLIRARIMCVVTGEGGHSGAVEWHWSATNRTTGRREGTPDGIIVELRAGQIVRWREYFDTGTDEPEPWQDS